MVPSSSLSKTMAPVSPRAFAKRLCNRFSLPKPTGEGTGLGLSLSYDIVVKVHSCKIDITSEENQGSESKFGFYIDFKTETIVLLQNLFYFTFITSPSKPSYSNFLNLTSPSPIENSAGFR
jgi:signal transduction histidine kinase